MIAPTGLVRARATGVDRRGMERREEGIVSPIRNGTRVLTTQGIPIIKVQLSHQ